MIACARRAFPRMMFSLMLAAPGLAMAADGPQIGGSARSTPAGTRKPTPAARKQIVKAIPRGPIVLESPSVAPAASTTRGEQSGMASWYGGDRWQGKRTSSGTLYDQNALTAAHATLPIGSQVRVTVIGTDRAVVVTINDRPGTKARIIDLSRAAAKELGILTRGIARVTLVRVDA